MNGPIDNHAGTVEALANTSTTAPAAISGSAPHAAGDPSTVRRQILVAEHHLDPAQARVVRDACQVAGAEYRAWNAHDRPDSLTTRAALAIGSITPGSRQIPNDLGNLVTDLIPGLPLVLLAQEALVRPIVTLHEGLVTLVDPTPQPARLGHCFRALLAETPALSVSRGAWWQALPATAGPGPFPLRRRELRVGASWVGVLEAPRETPSAPVPPTTWLRTGAGISTVLTTSREEPAPETGDLGGAAAFVQLEATDTRLDWFFLAGKGGAAMALFSTQRFPPFTDLGRLSAHGEVGSRRLAAAPGDLAVAIAPAEALGALATLGVDPDVGGATVLDRLEARMRRAAVPCSCVVIEVR